MRNAPRWLDTVGFAPLVRGTSRSRFAGSSSRPPVAGGFLKYRPLVSIRKYSEMIRSIMVKVDALCVTVDRRTVDSSNDNECRMSSGRNEEGGEVGGRHGGKQRNTRHLGLRKAQQAHAARKR